MNLLEVKVIQDWFDQVIEGLWIRQWINVCRERPLLEMAIVSWLGDWHILGMATVTFSQ
jgi:hypothetical protein